MKNKIWVIIFISAIILGACSNNEPEKEVETDIESEVEGESEVKVEDEEAETENVESDDTEDTEAEDEITDTSSDENGDPASQNSVSQSIDSEFIMENIKPGMTELEIIELLGEPDVKGVDVMYADPIWRYDIGAQEDYEFEQPEGHEEYGIVGEADLDGVRNKNLDIQLFVSWLDNEVYSVSHTFLRDGQLVSHLLFPDGTQKEDIHE